MDFEYDQHKNRSNIIKHGIDFADAESIFMYPMLIREVVRSDYGEQRWISIGLLKGIVVVMVFTIRRGKMRIISIRKANLKERDIYNEKVRK
ncbi:MAG: BrnT family toxin [Bacteroidales bacterium]|nr:BrnT family toxin [Bacteroidales bacterium]